MPRRLRHYSQKKPSHTFTRVTAKSIGLRRLESVLKTDRDRQERLYGPAEPETCGTAMPGAVIAVIRLDI